MNGDQGKPSEARSLRDGQWYWAPKTVIQEMARETGFLALAVYHFLASMADGRQVCFPSQTYIAERLGCSRSSVTRAIKTLESKGLIRVDREGMDQNSYRLLRVGGGTGAPPMSAGAPFDVNGCDTNDIRLTKGDTNERDVSNRKKPSSETFQPASEEELLARDLAVALNEADEISFYLSLVRTYSESFLRETLAKVNETPRHRIKKSRAALFTYLVRRYGNATG